MGLVHSRLKRVVFAVCDNINGALSGPSGIRRLHGVRSLNHHYSVFSFDAEEI
jgi:tRNA-specific adenosine deaminase 3